MMVYNWPTILYPAETGGWEQVVREEIVEKK
ncbi:hypothetical protein MKMG_01853 [Methanogenium sp. MK-MG]|nr:hypothetical protein MKMG_01853 [Methanogenium sp. MK-MG]